MQYSLSRIHSPLGDVIAVATDTHLVLLEFADSEQLAKKLDSFGFVMPIKEEAGDARGISEIIKQTILQLGEYFEGKRGIFTIPLAPTGTEFQKIAWKALEKIPYGETRSYQEEAILAGNPKAVRAIGGANNKNPIVIIIPCHRVIGKSGLLVGYGGGIDRKIWLLEHEKNNPSSQGGG